MLDIFQSVPWSLKAGVYSQPIFIYVTYDNASDLSGTTTVMRYMTVPDFRKLPYIVWCTFSRLRFPSSPLLGTSPFASVHEYLYSSATVVLAVYGDSFLFILGSTMLQFSIPLGTYITACRVATVLCICFYVSTKVRHGFLFMVIHCHTFITSANISLNLRSDGK